MRRRSALRDGSGRGDRGRAPADLSDTGTIAFNDVDLIDAHTYSVVSEQRHAGRHADVG